MAQNHAFVTYQEAERLTGKTMRTIRRKIQTGIISESQIRKDNGQVTIAVVELERVFGKLRVPLSDLSVPENGQDRTAVPEMSGEATGILREYLDFMKAQVEWQQRRNERLEHAVHDMQEDLRRTQEQLSLLLPRRTNSAAAKEDKSGQERGHEAKPSRNTRSWRFWKRQK